MRKTEEIAASEETAMPVRAPVEKRLSAELSEALIPPVPVGAAEPVPSTTLLESEPSE